MHDDETTWTVPDPGSSGPSRRRGSAAGAGITLTGIDVPFFQLTLFFVKASLAMAMALTLTSAVWVAVGGLIAGITLGGWLALTAIFGPYNAPYTPPPVTPSVVMAPPPPPPELPPEPLPTEEVAGDPSIAPAAGSEPLDPPKTSVEASDAATDAAARAELERLRQRRTGN